MQQGSDGSNFATFDEKKKKKILTKPSSDRETAKKNSLKI